MVLRRTGGAGSALSFGRSRGRMHAQEDLDITFDHVAGVDEAVEELREIVEFLRQRSRPYLFSNPLPPPIVMAAAKALALVQSGNTLRDRLHANARQMRAGLESAGFTLKPGRHPILPVMLGDAALAATMADKLLERGIYAITSFIFGMDGDTAGVAKRTQDVMDSWPPGLPVYGLLTPYPATPLYDRLRDSGRLTRPKHWLDFRPFRMAFTPDKISIDQAEMEVREAQLLPKERTRGCSILRHDAYMPQMR